MKNKYFGTDGIRGTVNQGNITGEKFFKFGLASGTYLLCVGITRFSDGGLEVIHRRYDAVEIEIFNADGSFGICNCNCKIEIQKKY